VLEALRKLMTGEGSAGRPEPGDENRRLRVATCALLLEAVHADDAVDDAESSLLRDVIARRFELAPDEVADLLASAERQRREATDLFSFTRLINDHFTRPQKLAVVELLWRVVYSDGRLEAREDALLHRVANLLQLRHDELIALKLQVKAEQDDGQN
jgi:uncharacterized tellurite resistance protein B-like protein